jgi:hypothetical protein
VTESRRKKREPESEMNTSLLLRPEMLPQKQSRSSRLNSKTGRPLNLTLTKKLYSNNWKPSMPLLILSTTLLLSHSNQKTLLSLPRLSKLRKLLVMNRELKMRSIEV